MKRKILLISVLAVLFSLTGCSGDNEKAFDYDEDALIEQSKNIISEYNDVSDEAYDYYVAEGDNLQQTAVKGFRQAEITDEIGEFERFDTSSGKVKFEDQSDGTVLVTIYCDYSGRDVEVTLQYEENLEYDMQYSQMMDAVTEEALSYGFSSSDEYLSYINSVYGYSYAGAEDFVRIYLSNLGIEPYTATECEVSAVYTMKELLVQAAQNTAIGMGTVFILLIVISLIIWCLKFVPKIANKFNGSETVRNEEPDGIENIPERASAKAVSAPAQTQNLMNDAELVAVITAAIYAAESQNGVNAVSKDKLVVRSIRKARKR